MNPQEIGEVQQSDIVNEADNATKNGAAEKRAVEADFDEEDRSYKSMPPRRLGTMTVAYRFGGRGRPLPYLVDGDEATPKPVDFGIES